MLRQLAHYDGPAKLGHKCLKRIKTTVVIVAYHCLVFRNYTLISVTSVYFSLVYTSRQLKHNAYRLTVTLLDVS